MPHKGMKIKRGLPRVVRRVKKQTGKTTVSVDRKRQALAPGIRRAKSGRLYRETRRNRSDRSRVKHL